MVLFLLIRFLARGIRRHTAYLVTGVWDDWNGGGIPYSREVTLVLSALLPSSHSKPEGVLIPFQLIRALACWASPSPNERVRVAAHER
jgi:hypothetical protein